jgi:hypothetical protein
MCLDYLFATKTSNNNKTYLIHAALIPSQALCEPADCPMILALLVAL